jgi:hypothetical protein
LKSLLLVSLFLLLCTFPVSAKAHTEIDVDQCVWLSTHVVVVTEGEQIDGKVTVIESWQGDLSPGYSLTIAELASFSSAESRRLYCPNMLDYLHECKSPKPEVASGSQIILFLRDKRTPSDPQGWLALGALWVEGKDAYGLWDGDKEWQGLLGRVGKAAGLKQVIEEITHEKAAMKKALQLPGLEARRQALQALIFSKSRYTALVATSELEALQRTATLTTKADRGKAVSLPTIQCADDCVGAIFTLVVKREWEFWKAEAPQLRVDWWNDPKLSEKEIFFYRHHSGNTEIALWMLRDTADEEAREVVKELLAYFLSLPQLKSQVYVINGCKAILERAPEK